MQVQSNFPAKKLRKIRALKIRMRRLFKKILCKNETFENKRTRENGDSTFIVSFGEVLRLKIS